MNRRKFVGYFNLNGQEFRLTTNAGTQEKAYHRMISGLSKQLSLSRRALLYHFNGERDNYHIQEDSIYDHLRKAGV